MKRYLSVPLKSKVSDDTAGCACQESRSAAIQLISWRWDVGGNADLDMPYDPNSLYRFESKGLVY